MRFFSKPKNMDILYSETSTIDEVRSLFIEVCVDELNLEVYKNFLPKTSVNYVINGTTPLITAVIHNSLPIIKFLVENGADVMATDGQGTLPYEYAIVSGRKDVEDFLFYLTLAEMTKIKDEELEKIKTTKQDIIEQRKIFLRGNQED